MSKLKATSPAVFKGGPGSGHHGHAGRPGKKGGSLPGVGGAPADLGKYNLGIGTAPEIQKGLKWFEIDNALSSDEANDFLNTQLHNGEQTGKGEWRDAERGQRMWAKQEIVRELSERSGVHKEDTNDFIKQWAHSANDDDMRSLSIQEAASEEFGVGLSNWQREKIEGIEVRRELHPIELQLLPLLPRNQERAILRSMYENTQDKLSKAGLAPNDTITLFRGVVEERSYINKGDTTYYKGNALESWSVDMATAKNFATGFIGREEGLVLAMDVPIKNIIGTARTGFGCLSEGEFVIAGGMSQEAAVAHVLRFY